jgi:hypothetical protein
VSDDGRDPRTDPRPGDVFENYGLTYEIEPGQEGEVMAVVRYRKHYTPRAFRQVMANARVVARGADRSDL